MIYYLSDSKYKGGKEGRGGKASQGEILKRMGEIKRLVRGVKSTNTKSQSKKAF